MNMPGWATSAQQLTAAGSPVGVVPEKAESTTPSLDKAGFMRNAGREVREYHENDDVDQGMDAHHHTLGYGPGQAAPGAVARTTPWQPAINNGTTNWDNYPGEVVPAFRLYSGLVCFKGVVRRLGAGGNYDAWGFLPANMIPETNTNGWKQVSCWTNGGMQVVYIRSDGAVFLANYNPNNGGYVFLDDISPFPPKGY